MRSDSGYISGANKTYRGQAMIRTKCGRCKATFSNPSLASSHVNNPDIHALKGGKTALPAPSGGR